MLIDAKIYDPNVVQTYLSSHFLPIQLTYTSQYRGKDRRLI
jgi:hypothetical protein